MRYLSAAESFEPPALTQCAISADYLGASPLAGSGQLWPIEALDTPLEQIVGPTPFRIKGGHI